MIHVFTPIICSNKNKKKNNSFLLDETVEETVEVAADLTRWSRELIKIQDFKNRVVCNSLSKM